LLNPREVPAAFDHPKDLDELEKAVAEGTAKVCRRDWHLARLWLGPTGGGPVVGRGATRRRSLHPPFQGHKRLLKAKAGEQLEVAAPAMFVGRRRELQRALVTLRDRERAGVLLHGMGRLGKSSLAARIADRRSDLRFAVVFKSYDAVSVLEAVQDAMGRAPRTTEAQRTAMAEVEDIIKRGMDTVRDQPEELERVLLDLLNGPCRDATDGRAFLLLADDLERVLVKGDAGGRHTVSHEHLPVVRAILRAFERSTGDGRLLVTSRYRFTLPDGPQQTQLADVLEPIQLAPFHDAAQRKLTLRQVVESRVASITEDERAARLKLADRAQQLSRGNPGLHDLLGLKLALNDAVPVSVAEGVLDEVEAYFERGDAPQDEAARAFVENLALDQLIDLAGPEGHALLRKLTIFEVAVPEATVDVLAGHADGGRHLQDLGLLDPAPDLFDPRAQAFQANRLGQGRLEPLSETEMTDTARTVIGELFEAWGGLEGRKHRSYDANVELTRLGLIARDAGVVQACAADAVRALLKRNAQLAASVGAEVVSLLEDEEVVVPLELRGVVASSLATAGAGEAAGSMLDAGASDLERLATTAEPGDDEVGVYLFELGSRQKSTGRFEEARRTFERLGDHMRDRPREVAITKGKIADILEARGELDEALRIRREEQLPVYERLGDVRSVAVTKGKIADVLEARGEPDEALRIRREEQLPVYERLGDVREVAALKQRLAFSCLRLNDTDAFRRLQCERLEANRTLGDADGIASALWDLAQLDLQEKKYEDAAPRIQEAFPILVKLARPDGIAVVGPRFAQFAAAAGQIDVADQVLEISEQAAAKIEQPELLEQIRALRSQIHEHAAREEQP
ncbi:MAG: ATP-binding protein, partial [Planctomycetes bacterium]|nr:ATP-binding protein [Planctomycetota bacterium]